MKHLVFVIALLFSGNANAQINCNSFIQMLEEEAVVLSKWAPADGVWIKRSTLYEFEGQYYCTVQIQHDELDNWPMTNIYKLPEVKYWVNFMLDYSTGKTPEERFQEYIQSWRFQCYKASKSSYIKRT